MSKQNVEMLGMQKSVKATLGRQSTEGVTYLRATHMRCQPMNEDYCRRSRKMHASQYGKQRHNGLLISQPVTRFNAHCQLERPRNCVEHSGKCTPLREVLRDHSFCASFCCFFVPHLVTLCAILKNSPL